MLKADWSKGRARWIAALLFTCLLGLLTAAAVFSNSETFSLSCMFLGFPGAMAFVVADGIHGGGGSVIEKIFGGFLYVLLNTLLFGGIVELVRWVRRRKVAKA